MQTTPTPNGNDGQNSVQSPPGANARPRYSQFRIIYLQLNKVYIELASIIISVIIITILKHTFQSHHTKTQPQHIIHTKMSAAVAARKRIFKTHQYRGVELDKLMEMSTEDFIKLTPARVRRRFARGLSTKPAGLLKKLRASKLAAPENEKPTPVRTHLRNMIVVPEMIGSVVGIYNGKVFNSVEIRPEMLGHYLGEFSITYTPVRHGRAGATTSRFIPLK